jgi:hypothetical protein
MQIFQENKAFFNSGTWIPIVEQTVGNLKEDKTYNYLEISFLEKKYLRKILSIVGMMMLNDLKACI